MSRRARKRAYGSNVIEFPSIPRRERIGAGRTVSATDEASHLAPAGRGLEYLEHVKHPFCESCPLVVLMRQLIAERKGVARE